MWLQNNSTVCIELEILLNVDFAWNVADTNIIYLEPTYVFPMFDESKIPTFVVGNECLLHF